MAGDLADRDARCTCCVNLKDAAVCGCARSAWDCHMFLALEDLWIVTSRGHDDIFCD